MEAKDLMDKAIKFHGHACPGVVIGVLVAKYILEHGNDFSIDEELVAVVENDNCSVDAIQALLGTTFGKGNVKHYYQPCMKFNNESETTYEAIFITTIHYPVFRMFRAR